MFLTPDVNNLVVCSCHSCALFFCFFFCLFFQGSCCAPYWSYYSLKLSQKFKTLCHSLGESASKSKNNKLLIIYYELKLTIELMSNSDLTKKRMSQNYRLQPFWYLLFGNLCPHFVIESYRIRGDLHRWTSSYRIPSLLWQLKPSMLKEVSPQICLHKSWR